MNLPPALYELTQRACGLQKSVARVSPYCAELAGRTVLDVGGGTGLYAQVLPPTAQYICLDSDVTRLARARTVTHRLVRCNATEIPLAAHSVDSALCIGVAHHLPEAAFYRLLSEIARVVRTSLIFLEPLAAVPSLASRILWKLDAGSYPRSEETLRRALATRFSCEHTEVYTVVHRYLLCIGSPARAHD